MEFQLVRGSYTNANHANKAILVSNISLMKKTSLITFP